MGFTLTNAFGNFLLTTCGFGIVLIVALILLLTMARWVVGSFLWVHDDD